MRHPYQCLTLARTGATEQEDVLLSACGSEIYARWIDNAELLTVWPPIVKEEEEDEISSPEIITASKDGEEPARKRRRKIKPQKTTGPIFTRFITSTDGRHLIATTGEDKSVFVFHVVVDGLKLLSKRQMTKRPCAIALTPKNDFILVGDKFGDVYALPLHPTTNGNGVKAVPPPAALRAPIKLAATELTVHSARNRRALESQRKQPPPPPKERETMDFEHELLLGHISMLTDVATKAVEVALTNDAGVEKTSTRTYIFTADRDEHIRVSRGRPQSWIIENYCFGHAQFVSKLCLPSPDILISGGGDDHLFVWDWQHSRLLGKLDLQNAISRYWQTQPVRSRRTKKEIVQHANDEALILQDSIEAAHGEGPGEAPEELQAEDDVKEKVAVSGIWATQVVEYDESGTLKFFCTCEAVPAVFQYTIASTGESFTEDSSQLRVFGLAGNPLDLVVLPRHFIASIDTVHEPASTTNLRRLTEAIPRLQCFALDEKMSENGNPVGSLEAMVEAVNNSNEGQEIAEDETAMKGLQDLLYSTENLRKRGNEDT